MRRAWGSALAAIHPGHWRRFEMTTVLITSERATERAERGDPVESGGVADTIGNRDEGDRDRQRWKDGGRAEDRAPLVAFIVALIGGGDRRVHALRLAVVEDERSSSELTHV